MESNLENIGNEACLAKGKQKYAIFAEQYLETPVYDGKEDSKNFSVTCCTFRGIPTIDDY